MLEKLSDIEHSMLVATQPDAKLRPGAPIEATGHYTRSADVISINPDTVNVEPNVPFLTAGVENAKRGTETLGPGPEVKPQTIFQKLGHTATAVVTHIAEFISGNDGAGFSGR